MVTVASHLISEAHCQHRSFRPPVPPYLVYNTHPHVGTPGHLLPGSLIRLGFPVFSSAAPALFFVPTSVTIVSYLYIVKGFLVQPVVERAFCDQTVNDQYWTRQR